MIEYVLKIGSLEFLATSAADAVTVMDNLSKMQLIDRMCSSGYSAHIYYEIPNCTDEISLQSLDAMVVDNKDMAFKWKETVDAQEAAKKAKETQP